MVELRGDGDSAVRQHVVVIGAGIVGTASALALVRDGHRFR